MCHRNLICWFIDCWLDHLFLIDCPLYLCKSMPNSFSLSELGSHERNLTVAQAPAQTCMHTCKHASSPYGKCIWDQIKFLFATMCVWDRIRSSSLLRRRVWRQMQAGSRQAGSRGRTTVGAVQTCQPQYVDVDAVDSMNQDPEVCWMDDRSVGVGVLGQGWYDWVSLIWVFFQLMMIDLP